MGLERGDVQGKRGHGRIMLNGMWKALFSHKSMHGFRISEEEELGVGWLTDVYLKNVAHSTSKRVSQHCAS